MYIPKINLLADPAEALAFMKRFSFATVITAKDDLPSATHLPFLVREEGQTIILTSHFARANEQWREIERGKVLVVFTEPHAYISPAHYEQELNVPTWNYISIHAYGEGKLVTAPAKVTEILEKTIENYEAAYKSQWNRFPEDYKSKLRNGIVAFEIRVTDLQAKKKLSQNRTESEKSRIIAALSKSESTNDQLIADYMKKDL